MEEFKIDLDYTRDDLTAYWYGFVWKRAGKPLSLSDDPPQWARRLGRFFCWFFIVMGAVSIVNSLVQGQRMRTGEAGLLWNLMLSTPLGGVLEIAFGAGCLRALGQDPAERRKAPPYPRWVERTWKKYRESGRLYSCRFTEEGIWIHDSRSDHRYDYEFIEALWEDADRFYLVLSNRAGSYILNKARFITGDPADLPAFWQAHTGKTVGVVTPGRRKGGRM